MFILLLYYMNVLSNARSNIKNTFTFRSIFSQFVVKFILIFFFFAFGRDATGCNDFSWEQTTNRTLNSRMLLVLPSTLLGSSSKLSATVWNHLNKLSPSFALTSWWTHCTSAIILWDSTTVGLFHKCSDPSSYISNRTFPTSQIFSGPKAKIDISVESHYLFTVGVMLLFLKTLMICSRYIEESKD